MCFKDSGLTWIKGHELVCTKPDLCGRMQVSADPIKKNRCPCNIVCRLALALPLYPCILYAGTHQMAGAGASPET